MTFPVVAELFVNGAWVDVSGRVMRAGAPTIRRGRADETSDVQPTTSTLLLNNSDGYLTPGNANSPWYPRIKRGLPCRIGVKAGTPNLYCSGLVGSRATTPDVAALDITGDIFGLIELQGPPIFGPADTQMEVVAKWVNSGNQRSWLLRYLQAGQLTFFWSTDGAVTLNATSTRSVPISSAGTMAFGWWLDVNNGSGGTTVTFYGGPSIAAILANPTAYIVGTPVTTAGTTSVFASTAPVEIGDLSGTSGLDPSFSGRVRQFQLRSGDSTGSIVANPVFTSQTVGTPSFTDSATRVWSMAGDAAITNRQHRFSGSVDSIGISWPKATKRDEADRGVALAEVTLSGPLRRLQQGEKALNSTLRRFIPSSRTGGVVHAYWPMEDGRDATQMASPIAGVAPMRISGDFSLASDDSLAASSPLLNIGAGDAAYMSAPIPDTIDQVPGVKWEVTRFFRIDDPAVDPAFTQLMAVDTNGRVATWRISINDTGVFISGKDNDDNSVVSTNFGSDPRMFDTWAQMILEVEDDGVNVDWTVTLIVIPGGFGFGTSGTYVGNTGVPSAIRNRMVGPPSGISTGHLIVTSGATIGWLAGADTAWVGETASHRFWRLCLEEHVCSLVVGDPNLAGTGSGIRGDSAYSAVMGPQRPLPLVDLLRECADTDIGIFFERRDCDGLAFRTRKTLYNQSTDLALDAGMHALAAPFEPVSDDQRIRNDVTASRIDGSSYRAVDQPSIDDVGLYDTAIEVNVAEDPQLGDQAGWRLHQGTWPGLRYPAVATGMAAAGPTVVDQWLQCDLGDRVTVSRPMRQIGPTVDQLIEGYDETFTFFDWAVSFNGSPEGIWEVGVLGSASLGKLDTAGSQLNSTFVAGTDTTMSVATTLGPLWTTDGGEFPFDLNVGGAQVTVTAIGAPSGAVQTFTVSTVIANGVKRSIPAGSPVSLWHPIVLAL